MPESKKLSELIYELIINNEKINYGLEEGGEFDSYRRLNPLFKTRSLIQNQIDQKFEELKYECKNEERVNEKVVVIKGLSEDVVDKLIKYVEGL